MKNTRRYRQLTTREMNLLKRLLHAGVLEREKFLYQARNGLVEEIDDDDSLFFKLPEFKKPEPHAIIAEAESTDTDGITIHFSVHVVRDRLCELEIYKDNDSRVKCTIQPENIHMIWPDEIPAT